MATNITKKNNSIVEIVKKVRNNVEMEILTIDGIDVGVMGYLNERDKQAGIAAIQEIVNNSDKHGMDLVMEVMEVSRTAAQQHEVGVNPKHTLEEIIINGHDFQIDYQDKTIYTNNGAIKVDTVPYDLDNESIKDILTDKAKIWLAENDYNAE